MKLVALEGGQDGDQFVALGEPEDELEGAHEVGEREVDVLDEEVEVGVRVFDADKFAQSEPDVHEQK